MTHGLPVVEEILRRGREELVLASRSARRRMLLEMLRVRLRVIPPPEDRPSSGRILDPGAYAVERALEKARAVAETLPRSHPAVIVGADTIVILDGEILEKPHDEDEARAHLRRLSGREHAVITGIALHRRPGGREACAYETSRVRVAPLDERTLELYVHTGEPLDKAGAYGIQGIGALFIEAIDGCYFNVVGLPLHRLWRLFRELEDA